jgi:fibro-slime domain-containing protein
MRSLLVALAVVFAGCSSPDPGTSADLGYVLPGGTPQTASPDGGAPNGGFIPSSPSDGGGAPGAFVPPNIVPTEFGGYALGAAITGDGVADPGVRGNGQTCNYLVGVARDFKGLPESGHPDFESFMGSTPTVGMVDVTLGADRKPVYVQLCETGAVNPYFCPFGAMSTSKALFDQWYRYAPGVNEPYLVYLQFAPNGSVFTFQSHLYFPLDNAGFGNSGIGVDEKVHNFGFTTELHAEFRYGGGEEFTFIGDDDVWVFMNGKLAIDLGGLHPPATGTIKLDTQAAALGLSPGSTYKLDLFQAERRTAGSTFRVDTNLAFTNCGTVVPDVPR